MTKVLHRNLKKAPPVAQGSSGRHVLHETMQRNPDRPVTSGYIDLSSGAGVTGLGHSNMRVKDAMIEQIKTMPYVHAAQWSTPILEEAAYAITSRSGSRFVNGAVTFFSGGSEAIEAACKTALQVCAAMGKPKPMFVTRRHSYHGGTFFSLLLGDHPRRSQLNAQKSVQTNCLYRFDAYAPHLFAPSLDDQEIYLHERASLSSLEECLYTVATKGGTPIVLMETVGGTTLAISPPTVGYLERIRMLVDEYRGLLIADEILGGNYRTGHLAAWQWYQKQSPMSISPDIVVLGKGITAGYFPMSAVVICESLRHALKDSQMGTLWATSTNQNHPIGAAAVVAALNEYERQSPMIIECRDRLLNLTAYLSELPHVKSVQGVGCLWGVCFNPDQPGLHLKVKKELFDQGISVYTDGGTVNGKGNMLLLAPPFSFTQSDADLVGDVIGNLTLI